MSASGMSSVSPAAATMRSFTAGSAMAFFTSALSLAMIGCGVFFGAHRPNHV